MARNAERMVKANTQWTPEQYAWLQRESERLGLRSAAAAARMIVQAAMSAERGNDSRTQESAA